MQETAIMESTLLPDMLRGGIDPLEKYLAREASDQQELRTLLLASDFIANVLDLVRKNVDRYLEDGIEGRQLISLLKDILVATEAAPRAIALVRERVVAEPDYTGRQEDLLAINLDHQRAEKL